MKLKKSKSYFTFLNEYFIKKRRKPQTQQWNKNRWVKSWLKRRTDFSACNNLFAELWLCDAGECVPFCDVRRIELVTLLKNELFYMYFFRFLTTYEKIPIYRTSQWLLPIEESIKCLKWFFSGHITEATYEF